MFFNNTFDNTLANAPTPVTLDTYIKVQVYLKLQLRRLTGIRHKIYWAQFTEPSKKEILRKV